MSADDKYPDDSGRRRFIKGVVGGASLAAVGTTGAAAINSVTSPAGVGGGQTTAMVIENTVGPAPRGMPQVPVEITDEGEIRGIWPEVVTQNMEGQEVEIARTEDFKGTGVTYSQEWFHYCGIESRQAMDTNLDTDNIFRSAQSPGYDWQSDAKEPGDPITMDDFDGYDSWGNAVGDEGVGKPAAGRWRSEGAETSTPVTVVRSPIVEDLVAEGQATRSDGREYQVDEGMRAWLEASTQDGVIAWLNQCTHFCCVPGYKTTEQSYAYDAANEVYCPCHQSVYDQFSILETLFVARPRPLD